MRLRTAVVALLLPLTLVQAAPPAPSGPKLPTTPFNFTKISNNPYFGMDVDAKSLTALRSNNKLLVGAVFQVRATKPTPTPLGVPAWTYVNVLVADCSNDTVTLLASRAFGSNGNQLLTLTIPQVYELGDQQESPTNLSHSYLCKAKVQPTPAGKGTLPNGYTSFWK